MPFVATIGNTLIREARVEWNVGDFFSLPPKVNYFCQSSVFSFAGAQWYMGMFPNGEEKTSSAGWLSLYLYRRDWGLCKVAYFTLGLKGCDGVEEKLRRDLEWGFSPENGLGYGFPRAWSRTDLRNRRSVLLSGNTLTVVCDLRSSPRQISVNGDKKVIQSLRDVLESGDDSDVVMKVQDKEFPAHRVILRARSPVFRSMFRSGDAAAGNKQGASRVVTVADCDAAAFPDFLAHVYSGSCEQISPGNVFSLFAAAEKYGFGDLKAACSDFLGRNVTVARFCDVAALAVRNGDGKLMGSATEFFCRNSLDVVKTPAWQNFLGENLEVGNELIIKTLSKEM